MNLDDVNNEILTSNNGWNDIPKFIMGLQSAIKEANENDMPVVINEAKIEISTEIFFDEKGTQKMRLPFHGKKIDPNFREEHLSKITFSFKYHPNLNNKSSSNNE